MTVPPQPSNEAPRPQGRGAIVDPVRVMILNLFVAGCLGYFRIGQKQKGIVTAVLFAALAFPTLCMGSFALSLLAALDAYFQAEQLVTGRPIGQWTFFRQHR